jgi:hypothetical protein
VVTLSGRDEREGSEALSSQRRPTYDRREDMFWEPR